MLATLLALEVGFSAVVLLACALYWVAAAIFYRPLDRSTGLTQPYTTLLALLAWAAALMAAFLLRARFPLLLFVVLFYLVAHSMESGLLPLEMIYEHRNYLPGVAICVAVAASFWKVGRVFDRLNFGEAEMAERALL